MRMLSMASLISGAWKPCWQARRSSFSTAMSAFCQSSGLADTLPEKMSIVSSSPPSEKLAPTKGQSASRVMRSRRRLSMAMAKFSGKSATRCACVSGMCFQCSETAKAMLVRADSELGIMRTEGVKSALPISPRFAPFVAGILPKYFLIRASALSAAISPVMMTVMRSAV